MTADLSLKTAFLSYLHMESVRGEDWRPLRNRAGKQLYRLLQPLSFYYAPLDLVITVPVGFVTDLDSTPRIPLVYLLINGFGDSPAVVHDYLYSMEALPRLESDQVLREACRVEGVPWWKVKLVYAGVRLGGGSHYGASS